MAIRTLCGLLFKNFPLAMLSQRASVLKKGQIRKSPFVIGQPEPASACVPCVTKRARN